MQDIHAIAGGSRLFSGGGGGGDRRLRPHLHHHQTNHQALKCPRCDSLNTKFCYYNNYNLSQPRHFCKSCRRYWTKGGVLRNVPVGGGCRKTKRSSKSKPTPESTPPPLPERKSSSHSSSESSSLTATTAAAAATEVISAPSSASTSVFTTQTQNGNQNFESDPPLTDCGIFSEIGSFTNMITSANDTLSFGFNNITGVTTPYQHLHQYETQQWQTPPHRAMNVSEELRMHEITTVYMDQTAQVDPNRSSNVVGGFGALDYGDHDDHQVLFDLPNTVDQAYWSQNHWTTTTTTTTDQAQDQSNLYLP